MELWQGLAIGVLATTIIMSCMSSFSYMKHEREKQTLRDRAEAAEAKVEAVKEWMEKYESTPPWIAVYYTEWNELRNILR